MNSNQYAGELLETADFFLRRLGTFKPLPRGLNGICATMLYRNLPDMDEADLAAMDMDTAEGDEMYNDMRRGFSSLVLPDHISYHLANIRDGDMPLDTILAAYDARGRTTGQNYPTLLGHDAALRITVGKRTNMIMAILALKDSRAWVTTRTVLPHEGPDHKLCHHTIAQSTWQPMDQSVRKYSVWEGVQVDTPCLHRWKV